MGNFPCSWIINNCGTYPRIGRRRGDGGDVVVLSALITPSSNSKLLLGFAIGEKEQQDQFRSCEEIKLPIFLPVEIVVAVQPPRRPAPHRRVVGVESNVRLADWLVDRLLGAWRAGGRTVRRAFLSCCPPVLDFPLSLSFLLFFLLSKPNLTDATRTKIPLYDILYKLVDLVGAFRLVFASRGAFVEPVQTLSCDSLRSDVLTFQEH